MILSLFSRMVKILDLAWSMTGSTIDLAEASYLHQAILDILLDGRDNLPDHVAHCGVQPIPTRHKLTSTIYLFLVKILVFFFLQRKSLIWNRKTHKGKYRCDSKPESDELD